MLGLGGGGRGGGRGREREREGMSSMYDSVAMPTHLL